MQYERYVCPAKTEKSPEVYKQLSTPRPGYSDQPDYKNKKSEQMSVEEIFDKAEVWMFRNCRDNLRPSDGYVKYSDYDYIEKDKECNVEDTEKYRDDEYCTYSEISY